MLNGNFREKDFMELAKRLAKRNIADVRRAYLDSLATPIAETQVGLTGGSVCSGQDCSSYGYAPSRK